MSDYFGTDEDDIIDASELTSELGNISGEGNDTILMFAAHNCSSPGEDNISGEEFSYDLWNATQE